MYRKLTFPLILGISGFSLLCSLGIWQLYRLNWKTEILANIEKKIIAEPVDLPNFLDRKKDQYLSVVVKGVVHPKEIHVLTSIKNVGPGFLVISPLLLLDGKKIMLERGFIAESKKNSGRFYGEVEVIGNLLWPNEIDSFTPDPNLAKNIWFGRDLLEMSKYLETRPILIVARSINPVGTTKPQIVGAHISNNHLSYAITWFSLAGVWFGMTILLVYRIRKYQI